MTILDCVDLYNPNTNEYVFLYNDSDSICCYDWIDKEKADELSAYVKETEEYWGGYLGVGGDIYDSNLYFYEDENGYDAVNKLSVEEYTSLRHTGRNLDWCEEHYMLNGWINTKEWR